MNGTDLIPKIIEKAQSQNKKFFLLGGQSGVIEKTKEMLQKNTQEFKLLEYITGISVRLKMNSL